MQELHQTVNEWSGELDTQKPLADTLAGVKKQQEVYKVGPLLHRFTGHSRALLW